MKFLRFIFTDKRQLILKLLIEEGPLKTLEIARGLGLPLGFEGALYSHLWALEDEGLIVGTPENGHFPERAGNRPKRYAITRHGELVYKL